MGVWWRDLIATHEEEFPREETDFSFIQAHRLSAYALEYKTWRKTEYKPHHPRCAVTPLGGRGAGSSAPSLRD